MLFENFAISARRSGDPPISQTCHDGQEDRSVVLRLRLPRNPFDAKAPESIANPSERAPLQKAREIVRRVRKKPVIFEPYEKIEILALDRLDGSAGGSHTERAMRDTQRSRVASQARETLDHYGIGAAREQRREQRIFLRARLIDWVADIWGGSCHLLALASGARLLADIAQNHSCRLCPLALQS
jgi:hypothetical protein